MRLAGERFVLELALGDVRLVGFLRTAEAAFALPPDERDDVFRRLKTLRGIRDERGERIRRLAADVDRAAAYAALGALAETTAIDVDMRRYYATTRAVEPATSRDLACDLVAPAPSATVPASIARSSAPDAVVVWCGDADVRCAALVVYALRDLGPPVVVVANRAIAGAEALADFVPLAAGAQALARARVAIAAHDESPADAIALARLGMPIVSASSSGARDYIHGAAVFRAWVEADVVPAVLRALASPPPRIAPLPGPLPEAEPPPARGPLVALRTRVALGEAASALTARTIAAQSYGDVAYATRDEAAFELIVPNGARLFPDAVARLVDAALRSGADRAIASALVPGPEGRYAIAHDGFVLVRRGAPGARAARVTTACGVLAPANASTC